MTIRMKKRYPLLAALFVLLFFVTPSIEFHQAQVGDETPLITAPAEDLSMVATLNPANVAFKIFHSPVVLPSYKKQWYSFVRSLFTPYLDSTVPKFLKQLWLYPLKFNSRFVIWP